MGLIDTVDFGPASSEEQAEVTPTFRSRRSSVHGVIALPREAEEDMPEQEHTGALFDAFVDRLATLRKTAGKIG